jgi:hypothetical protein
MPDMDLSEMTDHLETIARSDDVPPSARVRAIEVLLRIAKQATPEDAEWERIVAEFGSPGAERGRLRAGSSTTPGGRRSAPARASSARTVSETGALCGT